jgi:hypothetical protein
MKRKNETEGKVCMEQGYSCMPGTYRYKMYYLLANQVKNTYDLSMNLPDLRQDKGEVTIEHLSVLQERLGQVLDNAYPGEGISDIVTSNFDPAVMREDILSIFTEDAFMSLFQTEMGKGVLIGAFYQAYIDSGREE